MGPARVVAKHGSGAFEVGVLSQGDDVRPGTGLPDWEKPDASGGQHGPNLLGEVLGQQHGTKGAAQVRGVDVRRREWHGVWSR